MIQLKRFIRSTILGLLFLALPGAGGADLFRPSQERFEFRKTDFPSSYEFQNRRFEVIGASLLKYKHIFKLYTGALYLDPSEGGNLEERAKRFEVVYLRKLAGMDLVNAGAQNLIEKFDKEELAQLEDRLNQMNTWWEREFNDGDRAAISYIPGKGTSLEINGEFKGWVEGEDFAKAYFSIWLGPNEVSHEFKQDLLLKMN